MKKIIVIVILLFASISYAITFDIDNVKLIYAKWQEDAYSVALFFHPDIKSALTITKCVSSVDENLKHKILQIHFTYNSENIGHIRVKFYRTMEDGQFKQIGTYIQQQLGRPFAYVTYDKEMPPDLTKMIATMRANAPWDMAYIDYVINDKNGLSHL